MGSPHFRDVLALVPGFGDLPTGTSFELGACYAPVSTSLTLNPNEMQVFALLRTFRNDIILASRKYDVTPHAIAGAIAWEALKNPRPWSPRSVGLGKVHLYNYSKADAAIGCVIGTFVGLPDPDVLDCFIDRNTVAAEVEARNYLPPRTFGERRQLLATPEGSIEYIGAIMKGIAASATAAGFEDIRHNAPVLTNVYQAHTLAEWEQHLKKKEPGTRFTPANPMALWVQANGRFLEEAVGPANPSEFKSKSAARPNSTQQESEKPAPGLEFLEKPPLP